MWILENEARTDSESIAAQAGKARGDIRPDKDCLGGIQYGAGGGIEVSTDGAGIGIGDARINSAGTVKLEIDLENLMDTYSNMLLRMALMLLKDLKLAEDAVQETFISFYTSFSSYRGEAGIKTYLSKILINECRQKLRTAWFRRNVLTAEMDSVPAFGANVFDSAHDRISLAEALMKLDAGSREVLLLHYYNDLSVAEISEVLDKPEGTIKSKLKRGRDRLKTVLQEGLNDE